MSQGPTDQQTTLDDLFRRISTELWRGLTEVLQEPPPEKKKKGAPPADLYPGAVPGKGGWTTFALYAPGKERVALVGDFNDWNVDADLMKSTDGGMWWVRKQLARGAYEYMFVVDGSTWIGDPYARQVHWSDHGPHAVVQVGEPEYEWQDGDFKAPYLRDQIIYELHVGDFSPEGTFEGVTKRLDYIQSLGVRAIELMPIWEFPMDRSWGYNPAFFMAPEKSYGTPNDLKRLVDAAHQRGIAVILDIVFNHTAPDHPFNQLYSYDQSPWYSGGNEWGMPDLNHWKDATKAYVRDVQAFWLHEYHIDGFRYDATAYIGWDIYNGVSYMAWTARQAKPWVYLIAEHLPQDPALVEKTELNAQWHDTFHDQMKANLREGVYQDSHEWGQLDRLGDALGFSADGFGSLEHVINCTENHDEERVLFEVLTNPHLNREIAVQKSILGAITLVVAAGVPMIYHGQEFGMDTGRTTAENKLQWERLETDEGKALLESYRRLLWFRNNHPGLRTDHYEVMVKYWPEKTLAIHRWNVTGDDIVALLNFSNEPQEVAVPFPQGGEWHEFLFDYTMDVGTGFARVDLPPSGGKIFTKWKNW